MPLLALSCAAWRRFPSMPLLVPGQGELSSHTPRRTGHFALQLVVAACLRRAKKLHDR